MLLHALKAMQQLEILQHNIIFQNLCLLCKPKKGCCLCNVHVGVVREDFVNNGMLPPKKLIRFSICTVVTTPLPPLSNLCNVDQVIKKNVGVP